MAHRYTLGSILVGVVAISPLTGDVVRPPLAFQRLSPAVPAATSPSDFGQRTMPSMASRTSDPMAERLPANGDPFPAQMGRQPFPEARDARSGVSYSSGLAGIAAGRFSIAAEHSPAFNDPSPTPATLVLLGGVALLVGLAGRLRAPASSLQNADSGSTGESSS